MAHALDLRAEVFFLLDRFSNEEEKTCWDAMTKASPDNFSNNLQKEESEIEKKLSMLSMFLSEPNSVHSSHCLYNKRTVS